MSFKEFFKSQLSFYRAQDNDVVQWITVNGAHIPIKQGQSRKEAIDNHFRSAKPSSGKPKKDERPKGAPDAKKHEQKRAASMDDFEPAPKLSDEHRSIETAAFKKVLKHEDEIIAEYKKKNGNVVNTDDFRPFFKDVGYKGSNSAAVQEPCSYLAKRLFSEVLQNKGDYVVGTAGGSGVGKSSAIGGLEKVKSLKDEAAGVLDSNFSKVSSAAKKIREVRSYQKEFIGIFVYRDPIDSFENGIVKRMKINPDEMGRIVPNHVTADNHIGAWETVKELFTKGVDDKPVPFHFLDNSLGFGAQQVVSMQYLEEKISYPSRGELLKQLNEKARELYEAGTITEEQYEEYVATP